MSSARSMSSSSPVILRSDVLAISISTDVDLAELSWPEDWLANHTKTNRKTYNIPSKGRLFDSNYAFWILQQRNGIRKLNCTRVLSHNTPILPRRKQHQTCSFSQIIISLLGSYFVDTGLPFRNVALEKYSFTQIRF